MHIATGITLQRKGTGAHYKVVGIDGETVKLYDETNADKWEAPRSHVLMDFEEFGPVYEYVRPKQSGPLITSEVHLTRCPYCGSTNLDPAAWMSDRDTNNTGPGCDDCGATAESGDKWNMRFMPEYTNAIGDAAEAYCESFKGVSVRLPGGWYWHEIWDRMQEAAGHKVSQAPSGALPGIKQRRYKRLTEQEAQALCCMIWGAPVSHDDLNKLVLPIVRKLEYLRFRNLRPVDPATLPRKPRRKS